MRFIDPDGMAADSAKTPMPPSPPPPPADNTGAASTIPLPVSEVVKEVGKKLVIQLKEVVVTATDAVISMTGATVAMTATLVFLPANYNYGLNNGVPPGELPPPLIFSDINRERNKPNNPSTVNSESKNWRDHKKLSPGEIKQLERNGWNHREKGRHGGQRDLYKDKEGNVYEKPKGGNGPGEPIGVNLKEL